MNDYIFSWAENTDGQMVHVDNVPNGRSCGCHCPHCKEPLLARHGEIKAHGFAHHSEDRKATLEICYQVILYKVAEHIIKTVKHIHAPSYYAIFPQKDIYFADVRIDGQYERADKQPDVVATTVDCTQYLIEFTFAHKVQHKQPVDYKNMNCLEIDLSGQTLESLENFLLKSNDARKWVNNEKYFTSIEDKYQRAGKSIRITEEGKCSLCPIRTQCTGAVLNGNVLRIENNGKVYRLCKASEYDNRLKQYQEEEHRRAEMERLRKMSLEERLNCQPRRDLTHIAYFADGTVKMAEGWSSRELHKKCYEDSILEFSICVDGNPSYIAAMYIRYRGYHLKDCLICEFCDGYNCYKDIDQPNARNCNQFIVSEDLRDKFSKGFNKWIIET